MTDEKLEPAISAYMSSIGKMGGKVGGKVCGPQKRRPPDHYRKMVDARNAQRARVKAERQSLSD